MANAKIFSPTMSAEAAKALAHARRENAKRDRMDRDAGRAAPADCRIDVHLRTCIEALARGLTCQDWGVVAEALDMLQQAELRARQDNG
jgi:hypothetical protein